jgi:ABC-type multidrug transport system fused ATPase/permease subunit
VNAVVGAIGEGKTALIRSIMGEMQSAEGTIKVKGSISYVPQKAWILNGTIRENILFGEEYDEKRYNKVIEACSMVKDLQNFPDGDLALVGARGVSLSGGQKARLCCARALYADADIVLMDDPLSAVDALVDRQLFNSWFSSNDGVLRGKTVLLVTHAIHHLSRSEIDNIIYLKEGKVANQGSFNSLMSLKGDFCDMVERSATQENQATEEEVAPQAPAAGEVKGKESKGPAQKEKKEEGKVNSQVYMYYIRSCGIIGFSIYILNALLVLTLSNGIIYYLVAIC